MLLLIPYLSFGIMSNPERFNGNFEENKSKNNVEVINVLIKKIVKNKIYSQNGKVFKIKRYSKVIKNYKNKPIIAELHFKNKKLVLVILK